MDEPDLPASDPAFLRQQAELELNKKSQSKTSHLSKADVLKLVHELEVYQVELQMQNDELLLAKEFAEVTIRKYTELYDFAPVGYFTLNALGEIVNLNQNGAQMLGKERYRLINSRFGFFVSDSTRLVFNQFLDSAFHTKSSVTCDIILSATGAMPSYVHLTGNITGSDGNCLVAMVHNPGRKQAEDALFENNLKLELAMQAANIAWWELELASGKVSFGKKKAEMLGYPPDKFTHYSDFASLLHPDDYDKVMSAMHRHYEGDSDKYEVEYRILAKSGEYKYFYDIGSITKGDAAGSVPKAAGIVIDITERKLTNSLLQQTRQNYETFF